jgi:hypothetical protein
MRTFLTRLIPLGIALLLIVSACKKKDSGSTGFTHRVISEKSYSDNVLQGEGTYVYSGNKLSSMSGTYGNWTSEYLFTYPAADKINVSYSETDGVNTYEYVAILTVANDKVVEVLDGTEDKYTFSYNSDGNIVSIKDYYLDGSWILGYESTYTYSSGKLMLISSIEYGDVSNYEDKYTFSYDGDVLTAQVHTYKSGDAWTNCHKYAYTFTSGKISTINYYYHDGSAWVDSGYEDFLYDDHGNLIEVSDETDRTEYTYEEGNGNFRMIAESMDYEYMYPTPNKKSQSLEKNFHGTHKFNPLPLFGKRPF